LAFINAASEADVSLNVNFSWFPAGQLNQNLALDKSASIMGLTQLIPTLNCDHPSVKSIRHMAESMGGEPLIMGDAYALNKLAKPAKSYFYKLHELLNFSAPYMIR